MKMNLYVWDKFCNGGYSDGLAFAVAETEEQAVEKVKLKLDPGCKEDSRRDVAWGPVAVLPITESIAFACEGGS